ncbi:MAG: radical SAM protein, partial [Planctomycetota bacterium]|nr:radical SAM protein [Planctomycetota bacterium]
QVVSIQSIFDKVDSQFQPRKIVVTKQQKTSFDRLPGIRWKMPRVSKRWLVLWGLWYRFRAIWRRIRVSKLMTRLLGPQYRRSRDLIEIDITYLCNLHCLNCNRSVTQAPSDEHMALSRITQFVNESINKNIRWLRIRILGGEPTLHPAFKEIIDELCRYLDWHPNCMVEVVSNGYGPKVQEELDNLPNRIMIENSQKTSTIQPSFGPFNMAPKDDPEFSNADFSNGCAILRDCGVGLTPRGYYPCAVAGGIDRILGENLGSPTLPNDSDDMLEAAERLCSLCGRFRDGHFIPRLLRPELTEEKISPSWEILYEEWRNQQSSLPDGHPSSSNVAFEQES